jgi:hypothetical protein
MTRSGVVAFCGHARHLLGMTPHRVSQRGVRRALGAIVRTAVCSGMLGATALTAVLAGTVVAQPRAALPNQGADSPAIPRTPATTPLFGDTIGYWQQRADYRIVATLDDTRGVLSAEGTLRYVNQSPDTLRELWLHQHLNAFRPGSRWSDTDEREGRSRFQRLAEPDFGYERFTRAPRIDGQTVRVTYPLAPDSTVVHLALPRPLAPRDSVAVELAWTARPSTLARRQGRRDRSVDFAQWYPKVAVYDRHGWKPNALVPAGEFHGEFGTFDVTLIVADDQVLGATGVPVSGDPGWQRVAVAGHSVETRADAYGRVPEVPAVTVPRGARAVRFYARDVHHFAWSASPGFRYEGGRHVRTAPIGAYRFTAWDTVAVHVLYRGDADSDCTRQVASAPEDQRTRLREACIASSRTQWENGRALAFGLTTLSWLEQAFGTYPYPQLTILKRIDGGGTEFPMMMQNGSASQGLTTHEGGHIYVYGILASNEWQSGWMDEGLTSYQTSMQTGATRSAVSAALAALNPADPSAPSRMRRWPRERWRCATPPTRAIAPWRRAVCSPSARAPISSGISPRTMAWCTAGRRPCTNRCTTCWATTRSARSCASTTRGGRFGTWTAGRCRPAPSGRPGSHSAGSSTSGWIRSGWWTTRSRMRPWSGRLAATSRV